MTFETKADRVSQRGKGGEGRKKETAETDWGHDRSNSRPEESGAAED